MIKFIISHNIEQYIDKLNLIPLDIQTAAAEASSATALKLQEINPEYAVVNAEVSGDTFIITADHIGYTDEINNDAKEFFIETFNESFKNLMDGR